MYCPKCGEVLKEKEGTFTCVLDDMPLSRYMASRLYSCFVSGSEEPEDFRFTKEGYVVGGRWFCPGCGVPMSEEIPGAVRCPECRRNIVSFIRALLELHPHATIRRPILIDGETSPLQCAGINRHEAENAKFLRERISDPLGPEFCASPIAR